MKTFIQPGDVLLLTAPVGGVTSGTGVKIGDILAIPTVNAAAAVTFNGLVRGVITHAKTNAQAWTEGQRLYWDNALKVFTTTSVGNFEAGVAAAAAANPSSTGTVLLNGVGLPAAS